MEPMMRNAAVDGAGDEGDDTFLSDLLLFMDTPPVLPTSPLLALTELPVRSYGQSPTGGRDDATSVDSRSSDCGSHSPRTSLPATPPLTASMGSSSTKKGGSLLKRDLDSARAEALQLTEELQRLRSSALTSRSAAMEAAQQERFKRRRAERECQQLRDAVLTQTRFIRGLRSVFSVPPSFALGLNMCHHLHNYTRLPSDRSTRWNEYATLAQETRLQSAMDILCRETESLTVSDDLDTLTPSLESPFIQTEMLPDAQGFSVTTTSVFAVDTRDLGTVLRAVCVASCDIMSTCPSYPTTDVHRAIVDPDAPPSSSSTASSQPRFLYRAMDVHYKSCHDDDEMQIESRSITLCKQTDDYAVVVWDFVDDDELHPTSEDADITRQAVGACLIRREMCGDGLERTVYRSLATRRYRYHDRASPGVLQRYYLDSRRRMRTNELLFWDIMLSEIAKEEAAYAQALKTLGAC